MVEMVKIDEDKVKMANSIINNSTFVKQDYFSLEYSICCNFCDEVVFDVYKKEKAQQIEETFKHDENCIVNVAKAYLKNLTIK
jgi:hypothetical protein